MPRNIKKECEWSKYHYTRYHLALTKEYADKLNFILKEYHLGYTEFMKVVIDFYYTERQNQMNKAYMDIKSRNK